MAIHIETGRKGEDVAEEFLIQQGYEILARNWRTSLGELDIIAKKDDFLVIVEVKTKSSLAFGNPEEAVNYRKQRQLVNMADVYIRQKNINLETRFDVISVVLGAGGCTVTHHERAFSPFD